MTRNQIDAEISLGKKSMDDAMKKSMELSKQLKKMCADAPIINSDISKNEERLESCRNYANFLKKLRSQNTNSGGRV